MVKKCPECNSENVAPTGVTYFSFPLQKEYLCFDCNKKFKLMEENTDIPITPKGYQRRPDLKGCFNCMHYTNETGDFTKFKCLRSDIKPNYTDVCDEWEIFKEC